ncbi:hypothetical protein BDV95DRAFT_268833 [Massariosphaeria phaeospora]|uniref:Xaa-Pro aminopeptidase n=1 Tax=Massariosphaeria phaeospora TaxID=100035 RepID=A0A7C8M1T3_9PLEO|nr:hypothetical protein BDV95DRAFT_268833 [Massariosphaeria phaeospora]
MEDNANPRASALDARNLTARLQWEQQQYWFHLEAETPLEKYPAKQHARRVQEKLGVSVGLVYLPGKSTRNNEDSDMPAPFRQRRYFYYLSGCDEADCRLIYDMQHDSLVLFIPRIDPKRVIWNGRGSNPAEALDKYDIDEVYYVDELQHFFQDWATYCHGPLYILHPFQDPLVSGLPIESELLQPAMNLARVVKDEHEIKLIRKANDISSHAHKEVLANILNFKNEAQVEGLFMDVCISKQAKQQAYDPIAASGPNAGTLHYDANNEDFGNRQLMCLDAGCEFELYASDITRTFPLSGAWPSAEAKNIYRLVQRMQEACIEKLAPGVRYLDLHIRAHQIAIDGLLAMGILHNGTREEIYHAGTSRAFFPHGLGHHVGLEVHDVGQGDLMSMTKGNPKYQKAPSLFPENFHLPVYDGEMCMSPTDPQSGHLEEGMVVTVEPGIYFSTYALDMFYLHSPIHSKYINTEIVARYLPVGGVRIEDDILITSKGHENLTTAPKGEAMLEIIRGQNVQQPSTTSPSTAVESKSVEDKPLRRAPGIDRHTPEPILRPILRSETAPCRRSVDFEPFDGPSLYSNFMPRSATTDGNVSKRTDSRKLGSNDSQIPVCGLRTPEFKHAYIAESGKTTSSSNAPSDDAKPACKNCTILVQSVDRLRATLATSAHGSMEIKTEPEELREDTQSMEELYIIRQRRKQAMKAKQQARKADQEQIHHLASNNRAAVNSTTGREALPVDPLWGAHLFQDSAPSALDRAPSTSQTPLLRCMVPLSNLPPLQTNSAYLSGLTSEPEPLPEIAPIHGANPWGIGRRPARKSRHANAPYNTPAVPAAATTLGQNPISTSERPLDRQRERVHPFARAPVARHSVPALHSPSSSPRDTVDAVRPKWDFREFERKRQENIMQTQTLVREARQPELQREATKAAPLSTPLTSTVYINRAGFKETDPDTSPAPRPPTCSACAEKQIPCIRASRLLPCKACIESRRACTIPWTCLDGLSDYSLPTYPPQNGGPAPVPSQSRFFDTVIRPSASLPAAAPLSRTLLPHEGSDSRRLTMQDLWKKERDMESAELRQ